MTFDPPPAALLFPQRPLTPPLTTIERRAELLFDLGVDALVAYPTDSYLLLLTAEQFFQQKLVNVFHARAVVEGPNFRFGRDRSGDVENLRTMCETVDIAFDVAEPASDDLGLISSTRIRQLLAAGELEQANAHLTHPYSLSGKVVKGAQRGRQLGFPTANLDQIKTLVPAPGVYSGWVNLNGSSLPAAINVGPNPTFDESHNKVEVHIINYAGAALYDQTLQVALATKIRDIQKFSSVDKLQLQLAADIRQCQQSVARLLP
jgi:riboflavin kinase/FMN adenylyltransferase